MSNLGLDLGKRSVVSDESLFGSGDGGSILHKGSFMSIDFSSVNGVDIVKSIVEVNKNILEELENFLSLGSISKVLSKGDKDLDDVGVFVKTAELLGDLLEVSLGFLDLDERSRSGDKSFNKFNALSDGFNSNFMFVNVLFEDSFVLCSDNDGVFSGSLSLDDQFLVISDKLLELCFLWVEIVKMEGSSTDSSFGISKSVSNFSFDSVVFLSSPGVFFLFNVDLEVKIDDKVSESGFKFIDWSFGLELELEEADSDLSPACLLEGFYGALKGELSRGFNLDGSHHGEGECDKE